MTQHCQVPILVTIRSYYYPRFNSAWLSILFPPYEGGGRGVVSLFAKGGADATAVSDCKSVEYG